MALSEEQRQRMLKARSALLQSMDAIVQRRRIIIHSLQVGQRHTFFHYWPPSGLTNTAALCLRAGARLCCLCLGENRIKNLSDLSMWALLRSDSPIVGAGLGLVESVHCALAAPDHKSHTKQYHYMQSLHANLVELKTH